MKRFSDTSDWRDPNYRKLSPKAKHLRKYLWDNCDCAGVIAIDLEAVTFHVGETVNEKHVTELGSWLQKLPNGKHLIPTFIDFQVGTPSAACAAHKPVIKAIASHGLVRSGLVYYHPSNSLSEPLPSREQEEDKEKEKKEEKEKEGGMQGGKKPTIEAIKLHAEKLGLPESEAIKFHAFYESNGWRVGKNPMRSWSAAMTNWKLNYEQRTFENNGPNRTSSPRQLTGAEQRIAGHYQPKHDPSELPALLAKRREAAKAGTGNGVAAPTPGSGSVPEGGSAHG